MKITTVFIAIFLFISCGSDSVAPDPESSDIETVDIRSEATAFHTVTDPDIHATLAQVRRATAPYNDVDKATADGYFPDDHWVPEMGYHHVNPSHIDGTINHLEPEVLVYQRNPADPDERRLGAVEYMIPTSEVDAKSELNDAFPGVEADDWHKLTLENGTFWTLHVWIWYPNPEGVFHGTNPRVGS